MIDRVIVLISYYKSVWFFAGMSEVDDVRKYKFICSSPAAYLYLKLRGFDAKFVITAGPDFRRIDKFKDNELCGCQEVMLGLISRRRARSYARRLYGVLEKEVRFGNNYIVTWNGDNINGLVMRKIKSSFENVKTGFFEISNFPNRIFVDSEGVNRKSSVYVRPDVVDKFGPSFEKDKMIAFKSRDEVVSSSKVVGSLEFPLIVRIFEYIYSYVFGSKFPGGVIKRGLLRSRGKSASNQRLPENFVLFPLQVRTDTQVVLNSDLSMREALVKILEQTDCPVVVTPHPHDFGAISELKDIIIQSNRVYVYYGGTYEAMRLCNAVYVINSTVGLEARLAGLQVVFLGKTFFSKLTDGQVLKYLNNYLVDADFLSKDMRKGSVEKMFMIMDFNW